MSSIVKKIASELNISVASVSRALNDRPGVSHELRARILEKAHALNYAPSTVARGLATSQSFALGFFVRAKPGLSAYTDPFYGEILHGIEQELAQSPYHLTIASLTDDILAVPSAFRFIRERRIDGMLLAGPDIPSSFILEMVQSKLPIVLVDNQLDHFPIHTISSDDEEGTYQAAQYLMNLGHCRIGILSGPADWSSNRRRVQGYQRALDEAGLTLPIVHVGQTTIESGQQGFEQLIQEAPDLTAIGTVNDSMAFGVIRAARAAGRMTPDNLSVVGFDNISWAELNDPPLTTLDVPKHQIGAEAARRLIALLEAPDMAPTHLNIAVRLIERGSTGPTTTARRSSNQ